MKNKFLIFFTFLFCVFALTACDFNKIKSISNTKNETTIKTNESINGVTTKTEKIENNHELEAIKEDEQKREILAEAKSDVSLNDYVTVLNNQKQEQEIIFIFPTEVYSFLNELVDNFEFSPTKIKTTIIEKNVEYPIEVYLWQEESILYSYEFYNNQYFSHNFDLKDFSNKCLSEDSIQQVIAFLENYLENNIDKDSIDQFIEILSNASIDSTWFIEDEDIENLYHVNIQEVLKSLFGIYYGANIYSDIEEALLGSVPDIYFTFINGKVRTFGIDALITNEALTYNDETKYNLFKANLYVAFHYDNDKIVKIGYDIQAKFDMYAAKCHNDEVIDCDSLNFEGSLSGFINLKNYSLSIKGRQELKTDCDFSIINNIPKQESYIEEDLVISLNSIKGTIDGKFEFDDKSTTLEAKANLSIEDNLKLDGWFNFILTTKERNNSLYKSGFMFKAENGVTIPEAALLDKVNSKNLNSYLYGYLNNIIKIPNTGYKISITNETTTNTKTTDNLDLYIYSNNNNLYIGNYNEVYTIDLEKLVSSLADLFSEKAKPIISEKLSSLEQNEFVKIILDYITVNMEDVKEYGATRVVNVDKLLDFFTLNEDDNYYYLDIEKAVGLLFSEEQSTAVLAMINSKLDLVLNPDGESYFKIKINSEIGEIDEFVVYLDLLAEELPINSKEKINGSSIIMIELSKDNDGEYKIKLDISLEANVSSIMLEEDLPISELKKYYLTDYDISCEISCEISFNTRQGIDISIDIDGEAQYLDYINGHGYGAEVDGFIELGNDGILGNGNFSLTNYNYDYEIEEPTEVNKYDIKYGIGIKLNGLYNNSDEYCDEFYFEYKFVSSVSDCFKKTIIKCKIERNVDIPIELRYLESGCGSFDEEIVDIVEDLIEQIFEEHEPEVPVVQTVSIYFIDFEDCFDKVKELDYYEFEEYCLELPESVVDYFYGIKEEDTKTYVIAFFELESEDDATEYYLGLLNTNDIPYTDDAILGQNGKYVFYYTYDGIIDYIYETY